MTYDQAAERWVRQRFKVNGARDVTDVDFEAYDTGPGCDTCDYGRETGIEVSYRLDGKYTTKRLEFASVASIVREVVTCVK